MSPSQPGPGGLRASPGPDPQLRRDRGATTVVALVVLVAILATVAATAILAGRLTTPPAGSSAPPESGAAVVTATETVPADSPPVSPPSSTATPAGPTPAPATPTPLATPAPKEPAPTSAPPEDLTGYVWPIRDARITSRFGPRGFGGFVVVEGRDVHDGLDLATFCGNRVRAAHDGTVLYAGRKFDDYMGYLGDGSAVWRRLERQGRMSTLPIVIVIDDGNGYRSVYVHLSRAEVEAGQEVEAGEVIGREGMTGYATGCHLHYTLVRMDGPWQIVAPELRPYGYPALVRERVDPLRVLPRDHPDAPVRLRNRFASPSPGSPDPSSSLGPSPTASSTPSAAAPSSSPSPTARP